MSDVVVHFYKKRKNKQIVEVEPFNDQNDCIYSAFQVPLLHINVRDWSNKKEKLLKIHTNSKQNATRADQSDVSTDYHFNSGTGNCYSSEIFKILEEEIVVLEHMVLHPNDFMNVDWEDALCTSDDDDTDLYFEMNNSWFESSTDGGFHGPHTHGPIGYSCVLYIDFDESVHEQTIFMNPFFSSFFGCNCEYKDDFAREGSLICFPSPVVHYTRPNYSSRERLICSWNMRVVSSNGTQVIA